MYYSLSMFSSVFIFCDASQWLLIFCVCRSFLPSPLFPGFVDPLFSYSLSLCWYNSPPCTWQSLHCHYPWALFTHIGRMMIFINFQRVFEWTASIYSYLTKDKKHLAVKRSHVRGVWKYEKKRAKMLWQGSGDATVPNSETTMRFFSKFCTYESLLRKRLL